MENHKHSANKISIYLSLLCAIHCLAMPVVIAIIPFASFFLEKYHWLELVVIFSTLLLGTNSIVHGYKYHHHEKLPAYLFGIGISILIFSSIIHLGFHSQSILLQGLNIIGAIFSAAGQIQNLRLSRSGAKKVVVA